MKRHHTKRRQKDRPNDYYRNYERCRKNSGKLFKAPFKRRQGVMVVDPHGELARDILSVIPRSMHDDTIYVNPASLYRFGRVIRVNPLQVDSADERYLVVMTFVNALHNLYRESWGPRLETILRNAANALMETRYNTLGNLSAMITDPDRRRSILEGVSSRTVRHFWNDIYENHCQMVTL